MKSLRWILSATLLTLTLTVAIPGSAHEWQAMRAEYQAELARARWMSDLDPCALEAYLERERTLMNQRFHAEYHRFLPRSASTSPTTLTIPGTSPTPSAPPRPR
jgi:hypothetical protein